MNTKMMAALAGVILAAGGLADTAHAQFYKGKRVTVLVNYPPGGPTDIEARIIARYLPKHIPGQPVTIVRNQGGGGGLLGTNYLGEIARPDGLTVGFFTWNVLSAMLGDPGLRVKYTDFGLVAGIENSVIFFMRTDTPPGVRTPLDIVKTSGFKALSLNTQSTNTLQNVLALDVLGVKYTAVPGYQGVKDVETAILQGEGQFASTALPAWWGSIEPLMARNGTVIPMWQLMAPGPDGVIRRSRGAPAIPTFEEIYESARGGKPSGMAYECLRLFIDIYTSMARAAFLPPKSPPEALDVMRKAFVALWKDEEFLVAYEKVVRTRAELVPGQDGEKLLARLDQITPAQADFLRSTIDKLGHH